MAGSTQQDDFKTTLDQISAKMATRQQNKIMVDGAKAMNRVADALESSRRDSKQNNLPSGKAFADALIKASPLFGSGFQTWMSSSLENQSKIITDLGQIDGNLKAVHTPGEPADNTDTEYLDLLADQGKEQIQKNAVGFAAVTTAVSQNGVILGNILQINQFGFDSLLASNGVQNAAIFDLRRGIDEAGHNIVSELIRTREEDDNRYEKERLARIEQSKEGEAHPRADVIIPRSPDDLDGDGRADPAPGGGGLAEIGGLIAILGLFKSGLGGFLKLIKGFGGIFTGSTKLLPMMGRVGKMFRVGPLALITAALDFGKGFFNAKEMLGKENVNFMDRMRAGVAEVLGGFGDLVDWVGKIFGFDTNFGKMIREGSLKMTEYVSGAWDSLVDWVKNDLFAGITSGTSLADIPQKLSDNLQTELTKLVDWISDSFSTLYDTAKKGVQAALDDANQAFEKNIKQPFKDMINSIVTSILDVIGKVVDLVPSYLGGDSLRDKFEQAKRDILGSSYVQPGTPPGTPTPPPQTPEDVATNYGATQLPKPIVIPDPNNPQPPPVMAPIMPLALGGGTMTPVLGKSAQNMMQSQSKDSAPASAPVVVQQSVNAPQTTNQTTNMTTNSLEPSNHAGGGRSLWGN